ncbi:recombinase family protein [Desulfosporosinus sp. BG]|uniref:recombinase family protein n=1 Tax=Desulfosporosinus sp. BG TaxID=1633135 RepID=UPI00083A3278|nr:recombinase family protein [Desulfosporosinus sp. BG]ODA42693.1 Mobile element protein [Desulfosporosinus sp. BG]
MERIIKKMSPTKPMLPKKKRVAAYARVSCGNEAMLHSLSAQVSYYCDYIQKRRDWQYVGVYADEASTGTKDDREQFQKLLADCRVGLINMVITKSISRFARNTVTLLEVIRELKGINVDVYFERENVHSISGDGELMLTILASFAQEESRSVSENCKWRIRKQFEDGEIVNWRFMFGYRSANGKMEIDPKEAEVVRTVFSDYINGISTASIARRLQGECIPTRFGGQWSVRRIIDMIRNEKYIGNALLQKKYVSDHLTKLLKRNQGQLPIFYVEGTHEAIVNEEIFRQAQVIYESNKEKAATKRPTTQRYPFSSVLYCPHCGKNYKRKISQGRVSWNCATFLKEGKAVCHTKQIPEETLFEITTEVLGLLQFDDTVFKKVIREIIVPEFNTLVFVFNDGQQIKRVWQDRPRSERWTEDLRQQAREREFQRRRESK